MYVEVAGKGDFRSLRACSKCENYKRHWAFIQPEKTWKSLSA